MFITHNYSKIILSFIHESIVCLTLKYLVSVIHLIRGKLRNANICSLDTIQDFLCDLGMKPCMHQVDISIFSINHVIVRPTKIIKDLYTDST